MGIRLILVASCLVVSVAQAQKSSKNSRSARVVNDSLVQGLSCQNLSIDSIYRSIREDAFEASKHMPLYNWKFWSRGMKLGACWGLSSMQRMMFYMGRYGERNNLSVQERRDLVMEMASEKRAPEIFFVEQNNLEASSEFWNSIRGGYKYKGKVYNVRGDIEERQRDRFFHSKNFKMVLSGGATSAKENYATVQRLVKNVEGNRLTLVNLRAGRFDQHIVIVKKYYRSGPSFVFRVYDSNAPGKDAELLYNIRSGEFTAPGIFSEYSNATTKALGVFVVDEDKRSDVDRALLKYYQSKCR